MDIEHIICIDYILRDSKIIPDIEKIINKYLGLSGGYDQIIEDHMFHHQVASQLLSIKLNKEFHILDHIKTELYYIVNNLPQEHHPEFIDITYTQELSRF